ncbi:hypothetical protein CY35_06G022700 [Sphagnum magellanicum]|nr:hypothetical protein CY35_06G022700 [Sphagnum magellanicum]
MPFPSISNRKFAATILPTNNGVLWDDDKLLLPSRGRSGSSWTARNRLALMAAGGSVIAVLLLVLIVFGVHLAEERRDLARLCGRSVTDTLREVYIKGKDVRKEDESSVAADAVVDTVGLDGEEGGGKNTRKKRKVLGVVGIQTGFDSVLRRKALRETWFPSTPEGILSLEMATGLAFRFVIGHSTDGWKMQELDKEIAEHKDFIRIDVDESYENLNLKTLAFFKAVYMLFDADFYVKADDDIYLRPDRLATLLAKERPTPRTYLGCMKKGPVITDPKMKWYEPNGYLLGSDYFLHAYGPIYALSAEVVASVSVARNNSYRMFMNEDVTIGAWMLAMDVTHEHNHALCDPECRPESIAVWDVPKCSGLCHPTEQLARLHQDPMCSMNDTHLAR